MSEEMKPYIILEKSNSDALAEEVNEKILEGYLPQGGIAIDGAFYAQAMLWYPDESEQQH